MTVTAWWFSEGRTLPHGDGRQVALGKTHKIKGEIIPCERGLHASVRAIADESDEALSRITPVAAE